MGKKERKHAGPRRKRPKRPKRMVFRDRREDDWRLDRLGGGGKVGGMEIGEKMM